MMEYTVPKNICKKLMCLLHKKIIAKIIFIYWFISFIAYIYSFSKTVLHYFSLILYMKPWSPLMRQLVLRIAVIQLCIVDLQVSDLYLDLQKRVF